MMWSSIFLLHFPLQALHEFSEGLQELGVGDIPFDSEEFLDFGVVGRFQLGFD